jgi:hypothetical protein
MSETKAGSNEFLLAEYDALRRKLDVFAQEQFVCARWALAFMAVFWSYLAVKQPGWLGLAYWTPAIVVVFLGMRTLINVGIVLVYIPMLQKMG